MTIYNVIATTKRSMRFNSVVIGGKRLVFNADGIATNVDPSVIPVIRKSSDYRVVEVSG
jgi:hypothetical protein